MVHHLLVFNIQARNMWTYAERKRGNPAYTSTQHAPILGVWMRGVCFLPLLFPSPEKMSPAGRIVIIHKVKGMPWKKLITLPLLLLLHSLPTDKAHWHTRGGSPPRSHQTHWHKRCVRSVSVSHFFVFFCKKWGRIRTRAKHQKANLAKNLAHQSGKFLVNNQHLWHPLNCKCFCKLVCNCSQKLFHFYICFHKCFYN